MNNCMNCSSCTSSMVKCPSSMMMWEARCTADNVQAVGGQSGLIPFLTVSCSLLKRLVHQYTLLWHGATAPHMQTHTVASWRWVSVANTPFYHKEQVVNLFPWYSTSNVHDSIPLTDATVLRRRNLWHTLPPHTGSMFNYPYPITFVLLYV